MSALRFLVVLGLGGCGGDAFSGGEPPAGSGGTVAGEGGSSGGNGGEAAGAMGGSAEGGGPDGGSGDAGRDGAAGSGAGHGGRDGAAGEGRAGQSGSAGAAGDGAGGEPSGDCNVTCCNGEEAAHTTFDAPLCVSSRAQAFCDEHGGPQRVEFGGVVVWEENECVLGDHNCVATCCDGSRTSAPSMACTRASTTAVQSTLPSKAKASSRPMSSVPPRARVFSSAATASSTIDRPGSARTIACSSTRTAACAPTRVTSRTSSWSSAAKWFGTAPAPNAQPGASGVAVVSSRARRARGASAKRGSDVPGPAERCKSRRLRAVRPRKHLPASCRRT
jgi:hypothetical protein